MKNSVAKWLLAVAISVGYGGLASGLTGQDADNTETKQETVELDSVLKHIENSLENANLPEQQKQHVLEGIRSSLKHAGSGQPIVFEYKFDDADEQGGVVKGQAKVQVKAWTSNGKRKGDDDDEGEDGDEEELEFRIVVPDGRALELKHVEHMREALQHALKSQRKMRLKLGDRRDAGDLLGRLEALDPLSDGRFMLGIALQETQADEASDEGDTDSQAGVVVERVFEESPAAEAGLQAGDVIVQVDGVEVTNPEPLQDAVQAAGKADAALKLTFQRDGEEQVAEIKPKKNFAMIGRLPQELRDRIAKIRSGADRIIVLDEDLDLDIADYADSLDDDADSLDDLRADVESLKEDVREIKAMLKKISERD